MSRRVRRANSRGGARDPTKNQKGSTWKGKVAPTPGAAPTGSGGGVNAPPATHGSVVLLPDGSRVIIDVNSPLPPGAVVEPGGYPRPDGNTPEQKAAAAVSPPPPKFDAGAPDPISVMGEAQRQSALQAIVGLNGVGGSAWAGENTTGIDYGLGFTRYAADVKDSAGNVVHRQGEVNTQAGYTEPTSFTSGDTVGGYGNTDASNPFSRASMLHKSYANANNVSANSFANRGQLSSGAYQRQQGRNTMGYDQGRDTLMKGFAARMGDFQSQRSGAYGAYDSSDLTNRNELFNRNVTKWNINNPSA